MKRYKKIVVNTILPKQGIFWVINGVLIYSADTINPSDFVEFGSMNHRDTWRHIQQDYKVEDRVVGYDYYPRGRIIICPLFDDDNHITGYDCGIYADPCIINDSDFREQVENSFDLYHSSCHIEYYGDYATDNTHYSCHNCRK